MKVLGFLLIVVAVAHGATTHKQAEMLTRVQATEFGATVLADLQSRLRAGDPIDALREFIAKIRTRIENEATNSTAEQDEQSEACFTSLQEVNTKINATLTTIAIEKANIARETQLIKELEDAIVKKKKQISDTQDAIAYNQESIQLGDDLRAENEQVYEQATEDAADVKAAVEEILAIEANSTLSANQDEQARLDAQAKETGAFTLDKVAGVESPELLQLEAAAAKITDPTAQSFIQLAALSAEAFGTANDVEELKALLNRLIQEVEEYTSALKEENEKNAADWAALKATMEAEIADWEEDLVRYNNELQDLEQQLSDAKARRTTAINNYNAAIDELKAQYDTKAELLKQCSDSYANYLIEQAQRKEELETLELIYEIIKDKLSDAADSIKQNVGQLMSGGTDFAKKCHCDHACSVFSDCCSGCDPEQLDKVPSSIPIPDYAGGEKERPSRDARALYGTYYEGGQFHF